MATKFVRLVNPLFNRVLSENEKCLLFLLETEQGFLAIPIPWGEAQNDTRRLSEEAWHHFKDQQGEMKVDGWTGEQEPGQGGTTEGFYKGRNWLNPSFRTNFHLQCEEWTGRTRLGPSWGAAAGVEALAAVAGAKVLVLSVQARNCGWDLMVERVWD